MFDQPVKSPRADLLIGFEIRTAAIDADKTASLDEFESFGIEIGKRPTVLRIAAIRARVLAGHSANIRQSIEISKNRA
jgi:hypothetical protein